MNMDKQGAPVQNRIFRYALWAMMLMAYVWSTAAHAIQTLPFVLGPPFLTQPPLELDPAERRWLDERKVLRVGIPISDYEPIDITSDRNRYQGISADYLNLLRRKLGTPVSITAFAKRERAVDALLAGDIDLLTSANGYERGIEGLAFSHVYMPDRPVVVRRSADANLSGSLHGKRVALLDGYADQGGVRRAYPHTDIVMAPTLFSAMEALAQGDVDAIIGNELITRSYTSLRPFLKLQIQSERLLPSIGLAFAMRGDDTKLKGLLDRALDELDESVKREVLGRWVQGLGADVEGLRIRLSPDERQWIRRHTQVSIASTSHPPYIYKDDNGQWVGLNVDVLSRISSMTGLHFVHQDIPTTQAALEALSSGKADMSTTLAENNERRMFLDFTYAYGGHNWVHVLRADDNLQLTLADMSGMVLAMPARHTLLELISAAYPKVRIQLVPTYADARRLVETGQARATIQNEVGAWMSPPGKLKVGRSLDGRWSPDRFAIVKDEPELLSIMNKALEEFSVAEMRAIRMKWLGTVLPSPPFWQKVPSWIYWITVTVAAAGLVSLAWSVRIKALERQRSRAEAQSGDQLAFGRALLDGIPDPIYVRDLQGRLMTCNRSYEESVGISFEQMNGRRLIDVDLIPRASAERMHADCMSLLRDQKPMSINCTLLLRDRQIETAQWMVPFYRANGELQGLLGGWRDMTEQKRLERELEESRVQEG